MEHLVNPFAEPMGEAADVGADRAGWPSSVFHPFVDFVGDIKLTVGFFLVGMDVVSDVFYVHFI